MAHKVQAWVEFGPRLEHAEAVNEEQMVARIAAALHQSQTMVKAILIELDAQLEAVLSQGLIAHLPEGTHFRPVGHRNGRIDVEVHVNRRTARNINAKFSGRWHNQKNIGKSEAEIVALWNAAHPDDPIETAGPPKPV